MDYLEFYDLEEYLLSKVRRCFHVNESLSAFDFFLIVRWKSNRARPMIAEGLREERCTNLDDAVRDLTHEIHRARDHGTRCGILIRCRGIGLPMATAILTVLYPEDFTVYDRRACNALGGFWNIGNRTTPARIWEGYKGFREAVRERTPGKLSLRDKDRWLWTKDWVEKLKREIENGCADLTG